MPRIDANPIALRAIRAILEATPPAELPVTGRRVLVNAERLQSAWPAPIDGLDEQRDAPWPPEVKIACNWEDGRLSLVASARYWRPGGSAQRLGLRIGVDGMEQELVWITVTNSVLHGEDGHRVPVPAAASFSRRPGETEATVNRLRAQLRSVVDGSGLPKLSPGTVEAWSISLPDGEIFPSPSEALGRLVHLALLKLPFLGRDRPIEFQGRPLLDLATIPDLPPPPDGEHRRQAVAYLPGGGPNYQKTLDILVDWVAETPRTTVELEELLSERFEVRSPETMKATKGWLPALGFFEQAGDTWTLSGTGDNYRLERDPQWLFDHLAFHFLGFEETLTVIDERGPIRGREIHLLVCQLLGIEWESTTQVYVRRNWLLSMGLVERRPDGDRITAAGRLALERHHEAVQKIRRELVRLPNPFAPDNGGDKTGDRRPPEERVDLKVEDLRPHLNGLSLSESVLASACAALSAGHHLLLVGPPGNGKTELAMALGKAARTLEICRGLRSSTATADWSTFETIGGYALEPRDQGQALVFRPGVFLQALQAEEWLLIDELNRGDVDRAFGELMTVLSGKGVVLPYRLEDGRNVSVGRADDPFLPPGGFTHEVFPTFRVIATMNTWDKTSLFRLSHALQRRFAILEVGIPDDATYARLLREAGNKPALESSIEPEALDRLTQLFHSGALFGRRSIGPAIALDIVRYLRRRRGAEGFAEALGMYLLPQLEGLDRDSAREVLALLEGSLQGWATDASVAGLRAYYLALFPELASKP